MLSETITEEGDFTGWPSSYLKQLEDYSRNTDVGEELIFENENIRIWSIHLLPGQRLPFHTHIHDYNWTCLTSGTAISRYATGRMVKLRYQKGDISYYPASEKGAFTHDLENTGDTELKFITVEYLKNMK